MTVEILIIDDDKEELDQFKRIADYVADDFLVYDADNLSSAMKAIEKHPDIGLILCDTNLDESTFGPDLAAEIKEKFPHIRIIGNSLSEMYRAEWIPQFEFIQKSDMGLDYFKLLYNELHQ